MDNASSSMERRYISSEVRFYTIEDLTRMLGWSENTVQKMFNDPKFPSTDYVKNKVVEAHALIDYFSRKNCKNRNVYWKKGKANARKK